ncbi:hypothetical protein NBRC111894_1391 [Sporolactobacillus inulinus]|uniref:Uncharacterized protein n=1 Tax=Sporolactobacillus inulinus TaxID=2078 RepID=A0A4Y1Z9V9_9BACL|nr:hypothetical protein NBRC111894_1391 [Sporolactobacillus inulinus]
MKISALDYYVKYNFDEVMSRDLKMMPPSADFIHNNVHDRLFDFLCII